MRLAAFAPPFLCALGFALVTRHAWEDWYITYRSSKNLADGHGLVYQAGAYVHSFTSPLGTLLPAAIRVLWSGQSDDAVLWVFRILQCLMLGLSGILLSDMARERRLSLWPSVLLLGLFCLDAKTLDFSTNGMETGFLVFFILLAVKTGFSTATRGACMTGVAWAGLMWTRPDGMIYIFALCCGWIAFPSSGADTARLALLRHWLAAGAWAALLYGPWLIWTQYYYGSFIPNSLIAKALGHAAPDPFAVLLFPLAAPLVPSSLDLTFSPPYINFGGWPTAVHLLSRWIAWACCLAWLAPGTRPFTRAMSLATLIGQLYLTFVTPTVFPWYVPGATIMSLFVASLVLQDALAARRLVGRALAAGVTICCLGASLAEASAVAIQMRAQQEIIEIGNRLPIGLWLREHARSPLDRVFLEPLGYIGFFSNLRMYGFPGQSSPDLVAARRRLGCLERNPCFAALIDDLKPDWLVLRPDEVAAVTAREPTLLSERYHLVKTFDVSSQVASRKFLPGRAWLEYDQTFFIFHRQAGS